MYQYWLYRSVNSSTQFQYLQTIDHPDSAWVDRNDIESGHLYAYTLLAVDSAGNQSEFSDTVAVGLPRIQWSLDRIDNDTVTVVPFSSILYDPDHPISRLTVTVTDTQNLSIQIISRTLLISPKPLTYAGPASFSLRVTDPHGFYDLLENIPINVIQTSPFGLQHLDHQIPSRYELSQNYPNPFNPATRIRFGIPRYSPVRIVLYNSLGQRVRSFLDQSLTPGWYLLEIDLTDLPSGIYLYSLESEGQREVKRLLLLK